MFIDEKVEKILDISLSAAQFSSIFDFIDALSPYLEDLGSFPNANEAKTAFVEFLNVKLIKAKALSASPGSIPIGWEIAKKDPFKEKKTFDRLFIHTYLISNPIPFDFDLKETLTGTSLFRKLDLHQSESISIAGLAACKIENKQTLLLAETLAPGLDLHQFIRKEEDFNMMKKAVEKTALALAELHSIKKGSNELWSETKRKYEENDIIELLQFCADKNFSFDKVEEKMWQLYEKACNCPTLRGYCHGDLSLHNVNYSKSQELVTFIDLATAYKSFDRNLKPMGYIPYDYSMFVFGLEKALYKTLHEHRFDELLACFEENYKKQSGSLPEEEHLNYNYLNHALSKLKQSTYLQENSTKPLDGKQSIPFLESYIQRFLQKASEVKKSI